VPTVAFAPVGDPARVAAGLAEHRVMAGAGDFYAVRLLEAMGQPADPGVVRLSFVHYTAPSEIDQAIAALDQVLG
jgi:selenocysteine lyase/cysteine desulfurase